MELQQKVDQYILDYIKVLRAKQPRMQPTMVAEFNTTYTEVCRQRAEDEYKKHGRWFYCEDRSEFGGGIRWDEVVTYRIYWQLYARYGAVEKIPNYSKENHEKAIAFWQSWQKADGTFHNIFTGKGGSNQQQCNGKYIPAILDMLHGRRPRNEGRGHGPDKPNTAECLRQIAGGNMNHGTATVAILLNSIHEGRTEYLPFVEHAVELAVARISRHTGMFHGRDGKGGDWSGYGTTAETMKGMLRLIGFMGVENMPYRHVRTDTLIENQEQMRKGPVSVKRNTAEMMVQCLLESPYRSDELLKALDAHSKVILEGDPSRNHKTGDYAAYIRMMFGPYLNWEGYEGRAPRTPFPTGVAYDYRVEIGPFGRCANVIRKHPEELLRHKDFSYEKYGLRARNTAHETREVVDIVPASDEDWVRSTDAAGRTVLTRTVTPTTADLENPYVKIKWSGGDIEILLNGILVKRKLAVLADFGAVHIPEEAAKTLKPGDNTLVIRTAGKAGALEASAGLIDWRSTGGKAAGELEIKINADKSTARMTYAVERVRQVCSDVDVGGSLSVRLQTVDGTDPLKPEGFRLRSTGDQAVEVIGADQSGVLYGCLELADRIRAAKAIPADLDLNDAPEFKLRGPCIGMQKLQKDPSGGHYHWPYTPGSFPFFYDKEQWTEYLDFLVGIRMNSLYLWNGHPFSSLLQLDDYPEALEVSPDVLDKNREMMGWLTSECDKRGIWLIQMFYNIHLPKGLGLGTQLSRSQPKAADYTRKSIAKFVEEYPNVGLLICLGEALSGKEAQAEWFTDTIIPGMLDGLKVRGWSDADLKNADKLPPIVLRGHHIVEYGSHKDVLEKGMKLYPNIMSMVKYNGESLTSETPRGKYQQYHKDMAKYSGTHMANMHLMSNLEPFRYADFSFIRNSAKAIRDRLDGNGLHLYPMNYWDWPNTPDKADITQLERDRLWFEIWARYCWKLDRDPAEERSYWIGRIAETYGTKEAAEKIYEAYDASGECAPRILRRFGITGGNRQCMSLGMYLWQLTDPKKAHVWQELYDSDSPPGETITQYINNEFAKKPHDGETPPQIIDEVLTFAARAVELIEAAAPHVTKNKAEFERLRNDMHCIEAMSKSYCAKVEAAMNVLRYRKTQDATYMTKALPLLEESLEQYRKLVALTRDTYNYANGMHGRQRVPKPGVYHWSQMVGDYEKELADFRKKVAALDKGQVVQGGWRAKRDQIKPWPAATLNVLTPGVETYEVRKGAKVFTDRDYALNDIAPHLAGLTGIRFSHQIAKQGGSIKIDFAISEPVKVLVGYFQEERGIWLQVPALEHVAHANDRGGIDPVLENVAEIGDANLTLPKVNVHAFKYEKGKQTLEMIGTGSYVILGVIPAATEL